jgi:hypothetical protein
MLYWAYPNKEISRDPRHGSRGPWAPVPRVKDGWLAIVRFDSETNLQA